MGTSKRERQKQARHEKIEELRRQEQRQATRRRGILIGLGIAAFLAFAIGYSVLASDDDDGDSDVAAVDDEASDATEEASAEDEGGEEPTDTTDTTEGTSETTDTTVAGVQAGSTECPPVDGSSERQIDFDGPFADCLEEGVDYQARFTTSEGEVLVDLLEDQMPNTVNNFVALARYGYYDETELFRTDPSIDIIQGGSPHTQDNRDPGPGYTIPDEGGTFEVDQATGQYSGPFSYEEGQLIMARSAGPDSSSAQFFFSTGPNVELLNNQGTYLPVGDVVEGLDVLQEIIGLHEADDSGLGGAPSREVIIESVEILEL